MKNIFKFFGVFLAALLTVTFTGCVEEELGSADVGLHIKVFFPTKVVTNQPMTINGSGFSDATEIVFPGDVVVTDFEIVSNDMIRVKAPSGIAAEGGHLLVRTADGEVESPQPLTIGKTVYKGWKLPEGDVVTGGSLITIYGEDMEFVNKVEFLDKDGNVIYVTEEQINRKGSSSMIVTVPNKVYEGTFVAKFHTIDGQVFDLPEATYEPKADSGYWETVKNIFWENEIDKAVSWSGDYRFVQDDMDYNNECIATFSPEIWAGIKSGTFYMTFTKNKDDFAIRVTTGHWSTTWTGADVYNGDERITDNGDGTYTLAVNFEGDAILDELDSKHLLFTGDGYTPVNLYFTEEVWVEGGTIEIVRTSIWKKDGSVGAASWSGGSPYRFAKEGKDGNKEAIAEIPADIWEKMKTTPFSVQVKPAADNWQIRVLDGWWSVGNDASGALDFKASSEGMVDNGDGTFSFVLDVTTHPSPDTPLADIIDAQHLLFAGDGFQILELYWEEEVFIPGGSGPVETVLWEGEAIAEDWGNQPNILSDAGVELKEADAQPGQTIYLYMEPIDPAQHWYLELVEGHWSGVTYLTLCAPGADTQGKFVEYDLAANDGRAALEITQEMLDVAYVQQWWGGTFIANGDNLKITKVSILQ